MIRGGLIDQLHSHHIQAVQNTIVIVVSRIGIVEVVEDPCSRSSQKRRLFGGSASAKTCSFPKEKLAARVMRADPWEWVMDIPRRIEAFFFQAYRSKLTVVVYRSSNQARNHRLSHMTSQSSTNIRGLISHQFDQRNVDSKVTSSLV